MGAQLSLPMNEQKRLGRQLEAVRQTMLDDLPMDRWSSLEEITAWLRTYYGMLASEAGVSARLRDLRKMKYKVEKRIRTGNLWEYRVSR